MSAWYLRFYRKTEPEIEAVLAQMRSYGHAFTVLEFRTPEVTVNPMLTAADTPLEVRLEFASEWDLLRFKGDGRVKAAYLFANPRGADLVSRQPGDTGFSTAQIGKILDGLMRVPWRDSDRAHSVHPLGVIQPRRIRRTRNDGLTPDDLGEGI